MLPRLWLLVGSDRPTDRPTMSLIELSWTAKNEKEQLVTTAGRQDSICPPSSRRAVNSESTWAIFVLDQTKCFQFTSAYLFLIRQFLSESTVIQLIVCPIFSMHSCIRHFFRHPCLLVGQFHCCYLCCQARSTRARRACALRAHGLSLADGAPTVGRGRLFDRSARFFYGNSCNSRSESQKMVSMVGN